MRQNKRRSLLLIALLFCVARPVTAGSDTTAVPGWMRNAVIYGIKPGSFVKDATYDDITAKIPGLRELGVNTIWLQPVFKTSHGGQGYDVTDFFSLREDLGTATQLKKMISAARSNGIRVLFDFVPNHTSIDHPFAKDVIKNGTASPYYDYYQHKNDGAPYSSFYHKDSSGFIYYFWKNLVNLNYDNEKVQQMIIDACRYWIREFGIDGYRFDAVWAVNARAPQFGNRLREALKRMKPDVLLLAEDKGNSDGPYRHGFDAAYDWTNDTAWVSQWSWQYEHQPRTSPTLFDHPVIAKRKILLERSLFSNRENNFRVLRFMENNDLPRFIADHSLRQTKMAAEIMFSMPGIPMLFTGQEIGFKGHPYSKKAIFDSQRTIQEQDSFGLFAFYRRLIATRLAHPALTGKEISEIPAGAPGVVAYTRGVGKERIVVLVNLDSIAATAVLPHAGFSRRKKVLDLLSGKEIKNDAGGIVQLDGYEVLWLRPN